MELQEFLEKFLPDCEKIFDGRSITLMQFCYKNFPEALQNFIDKICKKQRELCAEEACLEWNNGIIGVIDKWSIRNAEQPKIEEL